MKSFSEWMQDRDPELLAEMQQNEEALKALANVYANVKNKAGEFLLPRNPLTGRTDAEEAEMRLQANRLNNRVKTRPTGAAFEKAYQAWLPFYTQAGRQFKGFDPTVSPRIVFQRHLKRMLKDYKQGRQDFQARWGFKPQLLAQG